MTEKNILKKKVSLHPESKRCVHTKCREQIMGNSYYCKKHQVFNGWK